jgi:hypothetical protein
MNWILDHLQLLFVVAGAVAWWLNQRRQAATGEDPAPPEETTFDDPELAERTRRIREEIQRKIEQRARAYTQPGPPVVEREERVEPPPVVREVVLQPEPPPLSGAAMVQLEDQRMAGMLEQQAVLAELLRQAGEMKAATTLRTRFETEVSSGTEAAAVARSALGDDLRNPDSLRRAFILREILGPPVALR